MFTYKYATSLTWGDNVQTGEMDVEVSYTVVWGAPEQGPSYASGGQPADPDEIDNLKILTINGKPHPWLGAFNVFMSDHEILDAIEQNLLDNHYAAMIEEAIETNTSHREGWRDD